MSAEIQYDITGASNFMYHSASQALSSLIHTESHWRCVRTRQGRAVGGLTSLTHQDPLCVTQLCSSLCSRWCLNARRHDWQPQHDADRGEDCSCSLKSLMWRPNRSKIRKKPLTVSVLTYTAAVPQEIPLKMNRERRVFAAASESTVSFIITGIGQSDASVELFLLADANKVCRTVV